MFSAGFVLFKVLLPHGTRMCGDPGQPACSEGRITNGGVSDIQPRPGEVGQPGWVSGPGVLVSYQAELLK